MEYSKGLRANTSPTRLESLMNGQRAINLNMSALEGELKINIKVPLFIHWGHGSHRA